MTNDNLHNDSKEITLDEYLATIKNDDNLFSIDIVKDKPEKIKISPVINNDCQCAFSIIIDKDAVEGVTPYGHKKCCGKRTPIVKIAFKSDASIALSDLFSQIRRKPRFRLIDHTSLPKIFPVSPPWLDGTETDAGEPTNTGGGDDGGIDSLYLQYCLNTALNEYNVDVANCANGPKGARQGCYDKAGNKFMAAQIDCYSQYIGE